VAGCCEYGDEPAGSSATDLVNWLVIIIKIYVVILTKLLY
jgi:hypothetical protein